MTMSESVIPRVTVQDRPIRVRLAITLIAYGGLALGTCLLAPLLGSTSISVARVFDRAIPFSDNVDAQIFLVARMPRVMGTRCGTKVTLALSASRSSASSCTISGWWPWPSRP